MTVIQPAFEIVTPANQEEGVNFLRQIERYARISHRSEDKQTEDSWQRFIKAVVIDKGDWSVTEHCVATAIVKIDRGVTHEWVRHRIGSYTQESTRFVNYKKRKLEFIFPNTSMSGEEFQIWHSGIENSEKIYLDLLDKGWRPQEARSILPNALASTLVVTYNLRNWRHFFMMRTTKETHPDFKRITLPMLEEFKNRIPLLYDDIQSEEKQSISLSKPK